MGLVGCGGGKAATPPAPVAVEKHANWPPDTLPRPEFLGVVDRQAGHVKGDAEPTRLPSSYQIPDWAEPTSTISAKGKHGAKITFHLLPRVPSLKKQDEARVEKLLKGKKQAAETLVVARPWIGWFGQGSGEGTRPYTIRVYNLFAEDLQLEVHVEWPTGDKTAFEEGQTLLEHIVYSVKVATGG